MRNAYLENREWAWMKSRSLNKQRSSSDGFISVCQRVAEKKEAQTLNKPLYPRGRLLFFPFLSWLLFSKKLIKLQAPYFNSNLHNRGIVWRLFVLCLTREKECEDKSKEWGEYGNLILLSRGKKYFVRLIYLR